MPTGGALWELHAALRRVRFPEYDRRRPEPGAHETELPATGADLPATLARTVLDDEPDTILQALLQALRDGAAPVGDWDSALHAFTFAGAVEH